jgi:hypothetical protein
VHDLRHRERPLADDLEAAIGSWYLWQPCTLATDEGPRAVWLTGRYADRYRREADGSLTEVGSGTSFVGVKETVTVDDVVPGDYVLRVVNFVSAREVYDLTAGVYEANDEQTAPLVENYTLTCEIDGKVRQTVPVIVDRGQQAKVDLKECGRR